LSSFYWPVGAGGGGGSSGVGGAKSVSVGSGVSSLSVTFTSAQLDTTYVPLVSILNTTDSTPIFLQCVITTKATTGMTITFNAPTDTANYVLTYAIFTAV